MKRKLFICLFFLAAAGVFAPAALLAQIPQNDLWKNKVLYVGGSWGLGPIFGQDGNALGGNLSPLRLDVQITSFLALGTGLNFYFGPKTENTALKQTDPDSGILETYAGMETHIVFPLLVEFTYRPGIFSVEIGGGPYAAPVILNTTVERTNDNGYTVSEGYGKNLFTVDRNNPFGFIASSSFGVKVWQGILFLNVSYLMDFSEITVKYKNEKIGNHHWNILVFDVGFKYGIFTKR